MNSKTNDKTPAWSRSNRSDLIDLSATIENTSSSNLLDLFDPLCHNTPKKITNNTNTNQNRVDRVRPTAGTSYQFLELKTKDRRFRSTGNVCTLPPSNSEFATRPSRRSIGHSAKFTPKIVIDSSGPTTTNSSEDSNSTKTGVDHDSEKFAKLSSNSYPSDESAVTSTTSDLNGVFDADIYDRINERTKKFRLARKHQRSGHELSQLTKKLKSFRSKFRHDDRNTNPGLVYSPKLYSSKVRAMSVKITINSPMASEPINFTCNASTTIEHLISHAVCSMFDHIKEDDSMENYMLKVTGKDEYFDSSLCLADYALVSHCWKFDLDVKLTLIRKKDIKRPFLRVSKDDYQCISQLCADDLLPNKLILRFKELSFESLSIIIETFDRAAQRLYNDVTQRSASIQTQSLLQTTKAICSLQMNCETSQMTESMNNLVQLCDSYKKEGGNLRDEDRYKMIEVIQHAITKLTHTMRRLLRVFSAHLPVDYEISNAVSNETRKSFVDTPINLIRDQISLRIHVVSQLKPEWLTKYQEFHLRLCLMHGESVVCADVASSIVRVDLAMFPRLLFDQDLVLSTTYAEAPRESRFVITLYGTQFPTTSSNNLTAPMADDMRPIRRAASTSSISSTTPVFMAAPGTGMSQLPPNEPIECPIASSVAYLFDQDLTLKQGDGILYAHCIDSDLNEQIYAEVVPDQRDPIFLVEFKNFAPEKKIFFPTDIPTGSAGKVDRIQALDFNQLDSSTKKRLKSIIDEKQVGEKLTDEAKFDIWDHRLYLIGMPSALPKVLLAAPSWSIASLEHVYHLVDSWSQLDPVDAMQLLLPSMPDAYIRKKAIELISQRDDDELCDYLPQLLQSLRYERHIDCPLFWLLGERALKNARIANLAYWQLKLNAIDKIFQERCDIMINSLRWLCGSAFFKSIDRQEELLSFLSEVSSVVKKTRDSLRKEKLSKKLERVQDFLMEKKPTMPWAPSLEVCDIEIKSCSYFPSKTLPLKLAFRSCEQTCNKAIKFYTYEAIFKEGDDLRQDMLAIQMIRIMEKLWLREGLDLRMVTFDCIATGERQGMVEMVQNAETLRKIQLNSSFLTGPFNVKAIDNYIRLWNTSELEYKTAVDNFIHSCAGYAVATYILGICDRHNDNIMVTTSGHLFHIDFGKFLGDAQMLGSIKRDRTPFVLTSDMAYVINGGDRPSKKFQTFIELCTMSFNIIRRNRNIFINLFALMSSAKIHGLHRDSVDYINRMLMPRLSEVEAMAKFARLIEDCLSSWSTQLNFFIHNLAQLKFSSDNSKQSLLSFVPKTFTRQTDGKIESLEIINFFKEYEPEKQYYFVVRVKRVGQPEASDVYRTFGEFSELQMKLSCMFDYCNFHDIAKSSGGSFTLEIMGRGNTREVAERRMVELRIFLAKLFTLPPEISHCDLIYTFFHPILRDQQTSTLDISMTSETSSTFGSHEYSEAQRAALYLGSSGQVKLSVSYKNLSLIIMIMHAKNLNCPEGSTGPNCYAKTYLLPDPDKQTKKKTRVVRQSRHPSFMELIVYKRPLESLKRQTLQVSIWHNEIVQNKVFLGAALIPLDSIDLTLETTSWYPLKNF